MAWETANLTRAKKFPKLEDILLSEEDAEPKEQTAEQMMAMARMLTIAYGGEIIEVCDE